MHAYFLDLFIILKTIFIDGVLSTCGSRGGRTQSVQLATKIISFHSSKSTSNAILTCHNELSSLRSKVTTSTIMKAHTC